MKTKGNSKSEYRKCVVDETGKYMMDKHIIPLMLHCNGYRMNKLQNSLNDFIAEKKGNRQIYVNKGRSVGYSIYLAERIAWRAVLSDGNEDFVVASCNLASTVNIMENIKTVLRLLDHNLWTVTPDSSEIAVSYSGDREFVMSNGCTISAILDGANLDTLDRKNISGMYLDEWLFRRDREELYKKMEDILLFDNPDVEVLLGSTPDGNGNFAYDVADRFRKTGGYYFMNPFDMDISRDAAIRCMKSGFPEESRESEFGVIKKVETIESIPEDILRRFDK